MASRWVYRNSDFVWMVRDVGNPALIHSQPADYTEVEIEQDTCPDPRTTRGQATTPFIRSATAPEMAAYVAAKLSNVADRESLAPSVLAMLGTIVRGRNVPVWEEMNFAERKQAIRNEAAAFKGLREFVDGGVK